MKVLLVSNKEATCFAEQQFVLYIERMLTRCTEEVMVYTELLPDQLEYDVIVMIGSHCINQFREPLYEHIPVVLFVTNTRESVHIPQLKNIAWVFFIDNMPTDYTNFIRELTSVTPMPAYTESIADRSNKLTDGRRNVAFIGDTTGLYPLKQVTAAFNELEGHKLWMFVKETHINMLREYANDTIEIKRIDQYPLFLNQIDLAVVSGQSAVDVLTHRIPVVIVGDTGFGGLVSTNNIRAHSKQSFSGRIGGSKGERIPVELILAELEWADKRLMEDAGFTEPVAAMVQEWFAEEKITKSIIDRIYEVVTLYKSLYNNNDEFLQMIPMRTEDITIRRNGTSGVLCRLGSKRKIMEFQEAEFVFIKLINRQRTIAELLTVLDNDLDVTDIAAFIRSLWEEKIIYFKKSYV